MPNTPGGVPIQDPRGHATTTTPGTRVRLVSTSDPHTRLRPGDEGTVTIVDSMGTVHVSWDNGSNLGLIPGEDVWREVTS